MKFITELFAIIKFILKHPLNCNHKISALLNFLKWQIGSRILKKKVIIPWVNDAKFIVGLSDNGLTANMYVGFMEYADMLFLLHALRPSETFVDIGANIGSYTILASKVVKAHTIAFEPLPDTFDKLTDQIQINRIESLVDARNMGVGNKNETLTFTNNNDTVNKVSLTNNDKNTTRVEVGTLNTQLVVNKQYIIKIDVEGFEYNVLDGASELLSSNNVLAIIIELNGSGEEYGHSNEEIHEMLINYNYIPVSYDPKSRNISILTHYNKDSGNTIYVKDINLIAERCKSALGITIHTCFDQKI